MATLPNHSAREVARFIEEGFDPGATLTRSDDPQLVLDQIDALAVAEDGTATPLTCQDVAEYLAALREVGQ